MFLKMRPLFFFIFVLLFLSNVLAEVDQTGWVDPHDMSPVYNKEYFPYDDIEVVSPSKIPQIYSDCDQTESQSKEFLKRIVNLIINAVHEDILEDNRYKGHLIFDISADKYFRLQDFTVNKFDDLYEIDVILSDILKKPPTAYLKEYVVGWCYSAFKTITSRSSIVLLCVLAYVFVVYKMMKGNFNYWAICKFLFINSIIIDFVFVWIRLYKEAEINKIVDTEKFRNAPNYCNPKSMTSIEIFWNAFSVADKCKDYYHVTLKDIFYTVSPGDVLSEMITKILIRPLKVMGPAIGEFVYGIYGALPFGVNIILLPAVLIFVMIMTCILLSFLLNVPIKFNFFHLISFSFGDHSRSTNGNVLTGRTVEQLLDIVQDNQTSRYLPETTNPTITNRMNARNEEIQQNNEDIRSRYPSVTNSNVIVANRMNISNEEVSPNNDDRKYLLEAKSNLTNLTKFNVPKEEISQNYEEQRKLGIDNSMQVSLNDDINLKKDKEEECKARIEHSLRASPRGYSNFQKEHYEKDVVEDVIKEDYEAYVVGEIVSEIKENEDGVRKRKRKDGAGDM